MRLRIALVLMMLAMGVTLAFAVSCGGDDDDSGGGNPVVVDPDEGQQVTESATPTAGGTLETPSGSAKLAVMPAALPSDVELTLDIKKPTLGSLTSVYDFGPDGTTFDPPARLTIQYAAKAGTRVSIARLDGSEWVKLDTKVSGDMLTAEVDHFTGFSVVSDDPLPSDGAGGSGASSAQCDAFMAESCLADMIGNCWQPSGACTLTTSLTTGDTSIEWANGYTLEMTVTGMSTSAPVTSEGRDGSGRLCFTQETVVSSTSSVSTMTAADGSKATLTSSLSGSGETTVKCPDGSIETHSGDTSNCVGGDQEACTVNMEGMGDIPGGCESNADCADGVCCDLGGMKMCVPAGSCPSA